MRSGNMPKSLYQNWQFAIEVNGFDVALFQKSSLPKTEFEEVTFAPAGWFQRFPGQSPGWEACGDVLSALDLVRVAVLIDLFGRGGAAHRFGASLSGFAVGLWLCMSQPAAGAEAHAAPPPGETSVIHILIGLAMDIYVLQHAHGDQRAEH